MAADAGAVARLNDLFRQTFVGGRVMMTQGVASLTEEMRAKVLSVVRTFSAFTEDNDPHREHDFGAFEVDGSQFFFKIDCYDPTLSYGSENPADPIATVRILTIMLADEY